jgi:hypothetical protein
MRKHVNVPPGKGIYASNTVKTLPLDNPQPSASDTASRLRVRKQYQNYQIEDDESRENSSEDIS